MSRLLEPSMATLCFGAAEVEETINAASSNVAGSGALFEEDDLIIDIHPEGMAVFAKGLANKLRYADTRIGDAVSKYRTTHHVIELKANPRLKAYEMIAYSKTIGTTIYNLLRNRIPQKGDWTEVISKPSEVFSDYTDPRPTPVEEFERTLKEI
jgi:hypothetical protein